MSVNPTAARGSTPGRRRVRAGAAVYPADAVGALVDVLGIGPARRCVDLAAGTGKLTRCSCRPAPRIVAVEPVAGHAGQVRAAIVPGVEVLDGTAEAIPCSDASVDVRHGGAGVPLVRRATKRSPRSTACCGPAVVWRSLWNRRDESVPWVRDARRRSSTGTGGRSQRTTGDESRLGSTMADVGRLRPAAHVVPARTGDGPFAVARPCRVGELHRGDADDERAGVLGGSARPRRGAGLTGHLPAPVRHRCPLVHEAGVRRAAR